MQKVAMLTLFCVGGPIRQDSEYLKKVLSQLMKHTFVRPSYFPRGRKRCFLLGSETLKP